MSDLGKRVFLETTRENVSVHVEDCLSSRCACVENQTIFTIAVQRGQIMGRGNNLSQ
jgi:hypothetical protein